MFFFDIISSQGSSMPVLDIVKCQRLNSFREWNEQSSKGIDKPRKYYFVARVMHVSSFNTTIRTTLKCRRLILV